MVAERRLPGFSPDDSPREGLEEARRRAEALAAAERRIADRFARLHAATAALSAALTRTEVAAAVATRGAALPGACGCAVAVHERRDTLLVTASRGAAEQVTGGLSALPLGSELPLAVAARERRAVFGSGDATRARDLVAAAFECRPDSLRGVAALPLDTGVEVIGAVGVVFAEPLLLDEEERAFLAAFAHQCAQALDRARLYEAEREARLEAQRAAETARHAVELQEQLVGIVGHDLRTPLAAITMSVSMLLRRGGLEPEQARALARVSAAAGRMARIIHDLLDFTRVRNGGPIPVAPRDADLADLVRRAVAELAAVHPDRTLLVAAPEAAPIVADPDRLGQVVTNLVGNAIQHSPPDARVSVSVARGEGVLDLEVHNEGPPIPADLLPAIFEPFRRGHRAGPDGGSLGLGLFIVREIVRAHGGAVAVRSAAGDGTTFTVRLPASGDAAWPASTGRSAADR